MKRILALASSALLLAACGEPLVVLGDAPGFARVVAGMPDSIGRTLDESATRSQFTDPVPIAFVDASALLYIADRGASFTVQGTTRQVARIVSVASNGTLTQLLDQGGCAAGPCLIDPQQMAPAPDGTLVIADALGHRVVRFHPGTRALTVLAGTGVAGTSADGAVAGSALVDTPGGVAVGADGTVYFTENGGDRIRRITADGTLATVATLNAPTALAVHEGTLYVSEPTGHRVYTVPTAGGTPAAFAGNGFAGFAGDAGVALGARLNGPSGLTVSPDGATLYIADSGNHRVRSVNLATNEIRTYAGSGSTTFTGLRLPAGEISLEFPTQLATGSQGFLFIADTGHQIVWRAALTL